MVKTAIVWFRRDLRLSDNPALTAAINENDAILPVFLDDGGHSRGAASNVWLNESLGSLSQALEQKGVAETVLKSE